MPPIRLPGLPYPQDAVIYETLSPPVTMTRQVRRRLDREQANAESLQRYWLSKPLQRRPRPPVIERYVDKRDIYRARRDAAVIEAHRRIIVAALLTVGGRIDLSALRAMHGARPATLDQRVRARLSKQAKSGGRSR